MKAGFVLEIRINICCNRKRHCWHYIFNRTNTGSVQKPDAVVAWNSPDRFLLSIRLKLVIKFRYVIINRWVHKSLNYQSSVSQMERPLLNILHKGCEVKHQICAILHLVYRVCRGNRFGQFIVIKRVKWDWEPTLIQSQC